MQKRILVDLLNLATPKIAGIGFFAKNLIEVWLSEKNLPYSITFYASAGVDAHRVFQIPQDREGIEVKRTSVQHVLARFLYQQIVFPFRLRNYDLYYNPTSGLPFLARVVSPNTKLVSTLHDMTPFFYEKKYSPRRSMLVKFFSKQIARMAHHIVTVSQNTKKDIVDITGIAPDRISIVYNFIPAVPELSNQNDNKYFLCISTIEPGKNIENTIKGFSLFRAERQATDYKFYWIGRLGWVYSEEDIRTLILSHGVSDSFLLPGYVSDDEKKEWIRNATAIVYLSHYEGFGLPIIEGMMFNKPSVVSNVSSLPEVTGDTGIWCDQNDPRSIADALDKIINDAALFKKNIPKQLGLFSPEGQKDIFVHLINDLLSKPV